MNYFSFGSNLLNSVTLGKNVISIGQGAFCLGEGVYFFNINNITNLINKTGREFNWNIVFDINSTDGNDIFEIGTFKYYYQGDKEVLITAE